MNTLVKQLGYSFAQVSLLRQALTHRSYGVPHNERLEFLGDGILNAVVARLLFDAFPGVSEGELSRLRASLVKKETLAELAVRLELGQVMMLGEGELRSGGRERASILADAMEAIFAAIYLDGGFDQAAAVIRALFAPMIAIIDPAVHGKDSKTRLQEWLQARKYGLPTYVIVRQTGEAHDQQFLVECRIAAVNVVTEGNGSSRRSAEQEAATHAMELLVNGTRK
ncbi:ribonuclease III [Burkholderiaceae bacterium DAT-1]|nr:ribonuclease III [Burkholderiaceae bacterium DAT-1]